MQLIKINKLKKKKTRRIQNTSIEKERKILNKQYFNDNKSINTNNIILKLFVCL